MFDSVWQRRTADEIDFEARFKSLLESGHFGPEVPSVLVHELGKMEERCEFLQASFPAKLHTVAIKANPLVPILRRLVENGMGLEAASPGELELARAAGCEPERTVFDSPAKTRSELRAACSRGITLNANSLSELKRLREIGATGIVGLRCNPATVGQERESATMVATKGSKFGVEIEEAARALRHFPEVTGLHLHVGSQVATGEDLVASAKVVVELARSFPQIEWLDLGGGLPTRYRSEDAGLCPAEYWQRLIADIPDLTDYKLVTEIGRALQAGCGWAATRVEYVAEGRMLVHLGADFGLRECYQPGKWFHELQLFTPSGEPKIGAPVPQDVFGPLCFSGDRLAQGYSLPKAEEGDILVIHDCGAYTQAMWSRYCSRRRPATLGRESDGSWTELRRPETTEDLVAFWS